MHTEALAGKEMASYLDLQRDSQTSSLLMERQKRAFLVQHETIQRSPHLGASSVATIPVPAIDPVDLSLSDCLPTLVSDLLQTAPLWTCLAIIALCLTLVTIYHQAWFHGLTSGLLHRHKFAW